MHCATYAHALLEGAPESLSPRKLLRGFDGFGLPGARSPGDARAEYVASFVETHIEISPEQRVPFAFEEDWSLPVTRRPASGLRLDGDFVAVAFTSDTRGLLGLCACPLSPSGGLARRAFAIRELRARYGSVCLFDLGAFSARSDGDHDLYVEHLARLGYDALTLDPYDLYTDAGGRRATWSAPPYVGCGIALDGGERFAASVVVARGPLRIAYVGASELLERHRAHTDLERRLSGVTFPDGADRILDEVDRLRPSVELVIVGGSLHPRTVRRLCADGSGVDAVLLGGSSGTSAPELGFIGDTLVAGSTTPYGIDVLELNVADGRIVFADTRTHALRANAPADPDVERALALALNAPGREQPAILGAPTDEVPAHDPEAVLPGLSVPRLVPDRR